MSELDTQLKQLISQACACSPKSPQRQRYLQQLHYHVTNSNKLWRERVSYYKDALQDMWVYCFQHLDDYDPTEAGVITWLDYHLKRILRNYRDRRYRDRKRHRSESSDSNTSNLMDAIPSRPDVSPLLDMWKKTVEWVQSDPGETLRSTCFRKRAEINAQVLFLLRFPHKTPWKAIAQQFNLSPAEATDLPKFYNRRCLPLLRNFGETQGYIDPKRKPKD